MKLRAKLILSFLGLAVLPLTVITLYSYTSSLRALRSAVEQESAAMAADMSARMESVSKDLHSQLQRFAAFEFGRLMTFGEKDRKAAMEALTGRLKNQMGENASFLEYMRFTPAAVPAFSPSPISGSRGGVKGWKGPGEAPQGFFFNFFREPDTSAPGAHEIDKWPPLPAFRMSSLNMEVRSGNEVLGNVSAEISSRHLLAYVLRRTQPKHGEIPFALDKDGKIYAANPNDSKTIEYLSPTFPENTSETPHHISTSGNWVLVTRKDARSDLVFGIARPIADRLGDLRRTTVRNMSYGLAVVALALVGIIPLSSRMTRNLKVLTREAENLTRGNLTARVPVSSKDEFGRLAQAFNRMAEDLSAHQKRLIEQERMQKELEMCRKIQEELLPRQSLRTGAISVKGVSIPAREVGGDFFNYFTLPGETMALLIGDVSGKGLPAALLMANLQATIQARLPLDLDLVKLTEQLDSEIAANSQAYLTLIIAVLDQKSLRLRYVNAGHNPQFLLHHDGSIEKLESTGRPVGLLAGGGFQEKSVFLRRDDSLFFYTDGLVEAQ
ncbi:MAG TPA: SpoIIE family protein phosphatase, partial [Acidobacteriota bacterium]|nr:SpoIIE family protein phosphatase [Acidobacteriota bacterium]